METFQYIGKERKAAAKGTTNLSQSFARGRHRRNVPHANYENRASQSTARSNLQNHGNTTLLRAALQIHR